MLKYDFSGFRISIKISRKIKIGPLLLLNRTECARGDVVAITVFT